MAIRRQINSPGGYMPWDFDNLCICIIDADESSRFLRIYDGNMYVSSVLRVIHVDQNYGALDLSPWKSTAHRNEARAILGMKPVDNIAEQQL